MKKALVSAAVLILISYHMMAEAASVSYADSDLISEGTGNKNIVICGEKSTEILRVEISYFNAALQEEGMGIKKIKPKKSGCGILLSLPFENFGYYKTRIFTASSSIDAALVVLPKLEEAAFSKEYFVQTHLRKNGRTDYLISLARLIGFSGIRDQIIWNSGDEPKAENIKSEYIEKAHREGLKVLATITPAASGGCRNSWGPSCQEKAGLLSDFLEEAVKKYKNEVYAWEILNEPQNIKGMTISDYLSVLRIVADRARQLQTGNVSLIGCGGGWVAGGVLGDCIDAIQKKRVPVDAVSIHPYMGFELPEIGYHHKKYTDSSDYVNVKSLSERLLRVKQDGLNLWISEIGWPSISKYKSVPSGLFQAVALSHFYLMEKKYDLARLVNWYDLQDDGRDLNSKEQNFGLITAAVSPKPSLAALAVFLRMIGSKIWVNGSVSSTGVHLDEFYSHETGEKVFAYWREGAVAEKANERIDVPAGKYIKYDWDGRRSELYVNGKLSQEVGPLPVYLVRVN
ncbi:hypothetical protein [Solimonas marina]|uniref:Glycoside hydrolase family 5 domain-containing protein n=1 Tax=Solimonas marina TaxID=2714601 RepID=A0A970B5S3_9GAMM|nr:hypothetical protein [Solimonas marina]NKF21890.1 hypothetical protein [Solimonas marina]